jgi:hypothetical protein
LEDLVYLHSLGYLGVTSRAADAWTDFATTIFGLEVEKETDPERVRVRWDERLFRLAVHPGDSDQIAYLGWETATRQAFASTVEHIEKSGFHVNEATDA